MSRNARGAKPRSDMSWAAPTLRSMRTSSGRRRSHRAVNRKLAPFQSVGWRARLVSHGFPYIAYIDCRGYQRSSVMSISSFSQGLNLTDENLVYDDIVKVFLV